MKQTDYSELLSQLREVARKAGSEIMKVYESSIDVNIKTDGSPVTLADEAAERVILNKLEKQKENSKPALSPTEMENIYKIAEQIDKMEKHASDERLEWREEDLIDLFGKKLIKLRTRLFISINLNI